MTTEIVDIPETLPLNPFPHVDDPEESYNAAAYEVGVQLPPAIERAREIVTAGRANAVAAHERAQTASSAAATAIEQADAAMGYRNAAAASASTATTKAGEAATSAVTASDAADRAAEHRDDAELAKQAAEDAADRAEAAAEATTAVPATDAEVQAGTSSSVRLMTPAQLKLAAQTHAPRTIPRKERTANSQILAADMGALIDIVSGTFTQTFDAPAALGEGWWCYLRNSGTGDITIPSSDGVTNWLMYSGEMRLFQSDGVTLSSVVLSAFSKKYTVSGLFIRPPGYAGFFVNPRNGAQGGQGGSAVVHQHNAAEGSTSTLGGSPSPTKVDVYLPTEYFDVSCEVVVGAGGEGGAGGILRGSGFGATSTPSQPGQLGGESYLLSKGVKISGGNSGVPALAGLASGGEKGGYAGVVGVTAPYKSFVIDGGPGRSMLDGQTLPSGGVSLHLGNGVTSGTFVVNHATHPTLNAHHSTQEGVSGAGGGSISLGMPKGVASVVMTFKAGNGGDGGPLAGGGAGGHAAPLWGYANQVSGSVQLDLEGGKGGRGGRGEVLVRGVV